MNWITKRYKAIISSDWNQCLAPCGPFDPITAAYPELTAELTAVFKAYTGNRISLGDAGRALQTLVPAPLSAGQMDAYLDAGFATYAGVPDFIAWCLSRDILFMINTTGLTGYFQRIFARRLLPPVAVLSSNDLLRYPDSGSDPPLMLGLEETQDKGRNTQQVIRLLEKPPAKCILMGDSGGDGPHFEWGAENGAYLIAVLPKPSLLQYCRDKDVDIDYFFDTETQPLAHGTVRKNNGGLDFMALTAVIDDLL